MSGETVAAAAADTSVAPGRAGGEGPTPTPGGFRRRTLQGDLIRVYGPLIAAIVALSLYTGSRNDAFLTWNNAENILLQGSVLAILALGQTFLIAAGQLDLSVGSLAAFSSVLAATIVTDGGSEAGATAIVLAMGAVTGVIWGLLVTTLRIPPFILTLGGLSIFRSLALQRADDVPVPVRGRFGWLGSHEVLGLVRTPVALALGVLVVSGLVLRYTRFGRHVYAVGSSEDASYLAGLPTNRTKVLVFVISSTLAAAAGLVLMARIGAGDPRSAPGYELQAIAAVVLGGASLAGGRGSAVGTYLGVVLLGVVSASLTFLDVDDSLNDFVFGSVLVFAVMATAISELRRQRVSPRERAAAERAGAADPPPSPAPEPSTNNVTSTESERP